MKQALFCLVLFTSFFCSSAQSTSKDTLSEYQFSDKQKASWDSLETAWTKKHYNPFLKKNKIKISCASCEGVYLDVFMEIHEDGHCHPKILRGKKCGKEFTKAQWDEFEKSFMLMDFPPAFYNTKIRVQLGSHLKC